MVDLSGSVRKNKLASGAEGNVCDSVWSWVIKYWSVLALNPVFVEGMIVVTTELEGLLIEEKGLEGEVGIG